MVARPKSESLNFQTVEGWAKLPPGWDFRECAGVAVDSHDQVYIFNRGEHPVMVFDKEGTFLRSWGEGIFKFPHGITIGPDGSVYCADQGDHTVRKFTAEGRLLMTLGRKDRPAPRWSGGAFNEPTHLAISPKSSDLFITDGYGNSRVHRYSPEGHYITSWGAPGIEPGHFVIPHNLAIDYEDNIYVADRENHRIQVFTVEGKLQEIWNGIWKPSGLCIHQSLFYIAELNGEPYYMDAPNVGHRISVYTLEGKLVGRVGDALMGEGINQFLAPHGIALDSEGALYVSEVSWTMVGRHLDPQRLMRSFQKLAKPA